MQTSKEHVTQLQHRHTHMTAWYIHVVQGGKTQLNACTRMRVCAGYDVHAACSGRSHQPFVVTRDIACIILLHALTDKKCGCKNKTVVVCVNFDMNIVKHTQQCCFHSAAINIPELTSNHTGCCYLPLRWELFLTMSLPSAFSSTATAAWTALRRFIPAYSALMHSCCSRVKLVQVQA